MKTSKWIPAARIAILLSLIALFFNAYSLFTEIRRTVAFNSRSYGLDVLNDYFDEGNYYQIYEKTIQNSYSDQKPAADASQYEAFGRYYHYYVMARTHTNNQRYLEYMEDARKQITWKKIRNVIAELERSLP